MKNIPDRIYLQIDDDFEDFNEIEKTTWCEDKINDRDIEYVLSDQWISVKDRLPEYGTDCLVYYCEYWNYGQPFRIAWAYFNTDDIFLKMFVYDNYRVKPTHWMPLPDPPSND